MKKEFRLLGTRLVILGLVLASCASPSAAPVGVQTPGPAETSSPRPPASATPTPKQAVGQPRYGGSITRVRENYPDTLDPHFFRGGTWWGEVLSPAYNGLLKLDDKMELAPDLVEKWEQPNELTYLLHLRQGVKFHDTPTMKGRELTAEDVKYNLQRMATEDPKFFRRWQFQIISSIETPDRYTIKITLKSPTAPFIEYLALPFNYIVGREAVEKFGDLGREEAGTGPFQMKSWTEKISYKLVRNPNYFINGVPYLDEVNVVVVPDSATRLAAFRSGRADYVLLSVSDFKMLQKSNPKVVASDIPRNQTFLTFYPGRKPFDDQRVRQAFSLAIDRQAVIDLVMEGEAELTSPVYGPAASWRLPVDELKRLYKPDIARAKTLMAEAGYPNGLPVEVKASAQRKEFADSLTVVAAQLKQIGVEVKQLVLEHTTLTANRAAGDYAALLHGGSPAFEVGERIVQYWRPGGMYFLKDDDLGKLIDEQQKAVNLSKRRELLNRFERLMIERAHVIFLFGYSEKLVRQAHVKGPLEPSIQSQHLVAYQWIEK
ncbi:MAG: ABC transporter substrate-binding protein [Chloroflexi bacterium]|nr:ABC transporter substrate-binding protein [Chloroflexota bacterium]